MDIRKINFNAIPDYMFDKVKDAYDQGKIRYSDIRLISLAEVANVYNSIKDHLYGMLLDSNDLIINRDNIQDFLEREEAYNKNVWKCYNVLRSCEYISTCGRGLMFDNDKIRLTEQEYNRLEHLYFSILV